MFVCLGWWFVLCGFGFWFCCSCLLVIVRLWFEGFGLMFRLICFINSVVSAICNVYLLFYGVCLFYRWLVFCWFDCFDLVFSLIAFGFNNVVFELWLLCLDSFVGLIICCLMLFLVGCFLLVVLLLIAFRLRFRLCVAIYLVERLLVWIVWLNYGLLFD